MEAIYKNPLLTSHLVVKDSMLSLQDQEQDKHAALTISIQHSTLEVQAEQLSKKKK